MTATSDTSNAPSALAAIPPPVTADRKTIVNDRVRTAADVVAAFSAMRTADLERSRQRALCQSAVDGAPPYSDSKSRSMGTYGRSNFNPGLAQRSTFKEQAPYVEVLEQMDILISMPTKFGDENMRAYYEPILSEGFTLMLKRWPEFNYLWQYLVSLFVRDGVSMTCWDDESDWRWSVYGLQHFKFPNESKPCEDRLDMCGWETKLNCRDLYKKVQNKKVAKKVGWNTGAVEDAIKQASQLTDNTFDPERLEQRWKSNDVLYGARAPQVRAINLLVKEVDGTMTHLVAPSSGEGPCFYEKRETFKSMSRFMTMFNYGVGTNGDLHSIRGHTSRIFPTVSATTRTLNAFVDMAMFVATPHLTVSNDDAMQTLPFRKVGYMTMLQEGSKFLETHVPAFDQNLIPLYSVMGQLFEGESSGASVLPPSGGGMERKTNRQESNERMSEGQLTTAAMALFFPAMERHLKEVARRVIRKDYRADEPGGQEVWWLRNWLRERGIDLEALYQVNIDEMEVNTGVGKGSQLARQAVADDLMEDWDRYDEKGKNETLRLKVSTRAGSRVANRVVPTIPNQRPGQQVENAMMQNGFLVSGNQAQIATVKPLPDQNSAAHVQTHLDLLQELWPMTQQQDQRQALATIQPPWQHCIDDWQMLDPKNPLYKQAKLLLRNMSEWIGNTAKELAAEEDRQFDKQNRAGGAPVNGNGNGSAAGDAGNEGPNMSNFARAIDAKAKLQYTIQANQEKLSMMADERAHRAEMNSLEKAGKVQAMNLKNVEAKQKLLA